MSLWKGTLKTTKNIEAALHPKKQASLEIVLLLLAFSTLLIHPAEAGVHKRQALSQDRVAWGPGSSAPSLLSPPQGSSRDVCISEVNPSREKLVLLHKYTYF